MTHHTLDIAVMIPVTDDHASPEAARKLRPTGVGRWRYILWPEWDIACSAPRFLQQVAGEVDFEIERALEQKLPCIVFITRSERVVNRVRRAATNPRVRAALYVVSTGEDRYTILSDGSMPRRPQGLFDDVTFGERLTR